MRLGRQDDVSICGEIASQSAFLPTLLDLGYRSFSISPVVADEIRNAIVRTAVPSQQSENSHGRDDGL